MQRQKPAPHDTTLCAFVFCGVACHMGEGRGTRLASFTCDMGGGAWHETSLSYLEL